MNKLWRQFLDWLIRKLGGVPGKDIGGIVGVQRDGLCQRTITQMQIQRIYAQKAVYAWRWAEWDEDQRELRRESLAGMIGVEMLRTGAIKISYEQKSTDEGRMVMTGEAWVGVPQR